MHTDHPRTLAHNVKQLAEFGYFKDLTEILYRLVEGSDADARRKQKEKWSRRKNKGSKYPTRHLVPKRRKDDHSKSTVPSEIRVANAEARSREEEEKEREMKTVFVFSDMEFDQASLNPWETDHQMIKRKYEECGYGTCMPQMVFWNLRESRSTPVIGMQKALALVSGYSQNMLKLFLRGGDGIGNPEEVMMAAISGPEYQNLQVAD